MKGSPFSRPFDDKLVPTTKKAIIKRGEVETYLYDMFTANKYNTNPTGNQFNISGFVSDTMYAGMYVTNAKIKEGDSAFEGLLSEINTGVYIKDITSPNIANGSFMVNFKGVTIEKGEYKYAINNGIIKSTISEVLHNVSTASKETDRETNLIAPSILVENIAAACIIGQLLKGRFRLLDA